MKVTIEMDEDEARNYFLQKPINDWLPSPAQLQQTTTTTDRREAGRKSWRTRRQNEAAKEYPSGITRRPHRRHNTRFKKSQKRWTKAEERKLRTALHYNDDPNLARVFRRLSKAFNRSPKSLRMRTELLKDKGAV